MNTGVIEKRAVLSKPGYPVPSKKLVDWVEVVATLCQPERVHWCDGSQEEYDRL